MRKLAVIAVLAAILPAGVFGEDLVFVFTPPAINLVLESTDTAVFNVNMQGTGSNPNSGVLFITYLNGSGWLTISPTSGITFTPPQSSVVITGRVSAAALPGPGVYQALVRGKGPTEADADAILLFPVTVVVKAPGPRLGLSQTAFFLKQCNPAPLRHPKH